MQNIKTQFGFTKVAEGEKQSLVSGVFSSVASKYDVMNDAMSLGVHRLWKRAMVDQLMLRPNLTMLDVASGTGDIARTCLKREPSLRVIATDINADMLQAGRDQWFDKVGVSVTKNHPPIYGGDGGEAPKTNNASPLYPPASGGIVFGAASDETNFYIDAGMTYAVADGSALPFTKSSVDRVSIAFGIRNIPDIEAALAEFHRVLRPGGKFVCMEFSKPSVTWLESIYDTYSFNIIPWLGEKISGDRAAYQYLVESIRTFPTQDQFASMIRAAGFSRVGYTNLSGGIVAVHSGVKI